MPQKLEKRQKKSEKNLRSELFFDFLAFGISEWGDSLSSLPAEISQFGYATRRESRNYLFLLASANRQELA